MTNADLKGLFSVLQYAFVILAGICVLLVYIYGKKADHDKARSEVPQPPTFKIESKNQLKIPQTKPEVSPEDAKYRRLQTLVIQNTSRVPIFNLEVFAQLPEALVDIHPDVPTGMDVKASDVWDEWYVGAGTNGVRRQNLSYTGLWKIGIGTLPAQSSAKFDLTSSTGPEGEFYKAGMEQPKEIVAEKDVCAWLLYGTYQFKRGAEVELVRFAVPIWYDQNKRTMEALPLVEGGLADGKWVRFYALPGIDFGEFQTFGTMLFHLGTTNDYRSGFKVSERDERRQSFGEFSERWALEKCRHGVQLRLETGRTNGASGVELLAKSAEEFRQALKVFDQERHPMEFAKTHSDLAVTLMDEAERSPGGHMLECLQQAQDSLNAASNVYTREKHPREWALTQLSLGKVLRRKSILSNPKSALVDLDAAIKATRNALRILTRQKTPREWASGQLNLGLALDDKAERLSGDAASATYKEAADASREALTIYAHDQYPEDWAALQLNLSNQIAGQARFFVGESRITALRTAINHASVGLEIFTRDRFPEKWAGGVLTKCNRLTELASATDEPSERIRLLRTVINELSTALEVRTFERSPKGWAGIRNNLGAAYKELGSQIGGEQGKGELDRSIKAFEDALTVFKSDHFPDISARISQSLEEARRLKNSL